MPKNKYIYYNLNYHYDNKPIFFEEIYESKRIYFSVWKPLIISNRRQNDISTVIVVVASTQIDTLILLVVGHGATSTPSMPDSLGPIIVNIYVRQDVIQGIHFRDHGFGLRGEDLLLGVLIQKLDRRLLPNKPWELRIVLEVIGPKTPKPLIILIYY